jgi:hypothetical protein
VEKQNQRSPGSPIWWFRWAGQDRATTRQAGLFQILIIYYNSYNELLLSVLSIGDLPAVRHRGCLPYEREKPMAFGSTATVDKASKNPVVDIK